jgi:O-antigen/teichoic acid export membrane protein
MTRSIRKMISVRRALLLATADRYCGLFIGFLTIATVSRLLTPIEIGLCLTGAAIVILASSVREFATYNFIIQRAELEREDIRSAFTVMLLLTFVVCVALYAFAPCLAAAFHEGNLASFLRIIGVSLLFEAVAAPIIALCRRDLAFGKLAIINIASGSINSGATLALAACGFSYMSVAWGSLLASAAIAALTLYICTDRTIFYPSLKKWQETLSFGRYYGANTVLYKCAESLLYLLLGRILSLDAVGLYNRALTVSQIPDKLLCGGLQSLVVPAFSAQVRQGQSVKLAYLRAIEYLTAVQWPALVLLALLAYPTVQIVLGNQWIGVAPLVQILAVASLFSFTMHLDYAVLISVGAVRDNLQRALIVAPLSGLITVAAAFYDLRAVVLSQLIVIPLEAYVSFWFLRRRVAVGWDELGAALHRSAIVAACSAACPAAVVLTMFSWELSIGATFLAVVLSGVGWIIGLWVAHHPMLGEIAHLASGIRQRLLPEPSRGAAFFRTTDGHSEGWP